MRTNPLTQQRSFHSFGSIYATIPLIVCMSTEYMLYGTFISTTTLASTLAVSIASIRLYRQLNASPQTRACHESRPEGKKIPLSHQGGSSVHYQVAYLFYDGRAFTPKTFEEITGRKHISISSTSVNPFIDGGRKKLLVKNTGYSGLGLFAGEGIKAGETICPYSGEIIPSYQDLLHMSTKEQSDALFPINAHYYADEGVLINHGSPNAIPYLDKDGKVLIKAIRKIKEGEEIFWNYGSSYVFDRLEHVNIDALVCMCENLYEEIKDVKCNADSYKEVGSYTALENKLSSESFKSGISLNNIQHITLLEYIFTRPLVLLQLRMSGKFTYSKLNVLRRYFNFSGGIRELRSEIYPWYDIAVICNMMELNDGHFNKFVSESDVVALYEILKYTTGYEEFRLAKFHLYSPFYEVFREFPAIFENNPLAPVTKAITECMAERNSGQLIICLDYEEYLKNFTSLEAINEFLLEISQKFPIFGDCLYDVGFKAKESQLQVSGAFSDPCVKTSLRTSLYGLVKKILPETVFKSLVKMKEEGKIKELYKEVKGHQQVNSKSYRAVLSARVKPATLKQISKLAEDNGVDVADEAINKNGKTLHKVFFGFK
jgi:uncharacterized protein